MKFYRDLARERQEPRDGPGLVGACDRDRHQRTAIENSQTRRAGLEHLLYHASLGATCFGKDAEQVSMLENLHRLLESIRIARSHIDGNGAETLYKPAQDRNG